MNIYCDPNNSIGKYKTASSVHLIPVNILLSGQILKILPIHSFIIHYLVGYYTLYIYRSNYYERCTHAVRKK